MMIEFDYRNYQQYNREEISQEMIKLSLSNSEFSQDQKKFIQNCFTNFVEGLKPLNEQYPPQEIKAYVELCHVFSQEEINELLLSQHITASCFAFFNSDTDESNLSRNNSVQSRNFSSNLITNLNNSVNTPNVIKKQNLRKSKSDLDNTQNSVITNLVGLSPIFSSSIIGTDSTNVLEKENEQGECHARRKLFLSDVLSDNQDPLSKSNTFQLIGAFSFGAALTAGVALGLLFYIESQKK